MTRWKILKWIACCLCFRFYSAMPVKWQARLFNEVWGFRSPFFFYLNKSIDFRPEIKAAIFADMEVKK